MNRRWLAAWMLLLTATACADSSTPQVRPAHQQAALSGDAFAAFDAWQRQWLSADEAGRQALLDDGEALALARREAFRQLMVQDPQRALTAALSPATRLEFPPRIATHLEQWRDGVGTLHVIGGVAEDGATPTPLLERFVTFDGPDAATVLRASVYGARANAGTQTSTRLHGVELDGLIAVSDSRLRQLFRGEPRPNLPVEWPRNCPVSRKRIDVDLVFHGGDTLYGFCTALHANDFALSLTNGEQQAAANAGLPPSSAWADGAKTVLYVRVDFSDKTGDPVSATSAQSTVNTQVNTFYVNNSFNKTSMSATVTPTLRLPKTQVEYQTNEQYLLLRSDALAAARDAGFEPNDYNLDVVAFATTYSGWAGRGYVGSRGTWLNGYFDLRVTSHELGHNYGLNHANYWNANGLTIIGPGSNTEYGNPWDAMGSNGGPAHHFNAWFKRLLNWMPEAEVATVSSSTTVRISELEKPLVAGAHAAKVPRDAQHDYWLEYRPAQNTANTRDGISINWGYPYNNTSHLLDMTPGDGSRTNSTLIIGRTFSDTLAGLHFTPIAKAGTTPEAIDVVVNVGTFPSNRPPTMTLAASATSLTVGQNVTFTATASDPDGDALAYAWDFDDGTWGANAASVTRSFTTARTYSVRLVVSDMKGGTVSRSVLVTVGTPTTFTLSGTVRAAGLPLDGARITDGTRVTFSSSDGTWSLTNVPAGAVTLSAGKVDFTFAPAGFTNPLTVAADQSALDFTATAVAGYTLRGKISLGTTNIAGVVVTDGTRTATTNSSGDYALTGVPTGRYTLSASKPGWNFVTVGFTNPVEVYGGDVASLNFSATGQSLSGTIPSAGISTTPVVTDGLRNATVTLSGANYFWYLSAVPNGSWNVLATSPGVTLTPSSFTNPVTVQGQSKGNLNFGVVAGASFLIQGTVMTGATPVPGVVVSDGTRTATTDSLGRYTLVGVPAGAYTLTPTHPSYAFMPATLAVTVSSANLTGKDFATTTVNLPPTVAAAASASPSPVVTGTTTQLTVLGADDAGEGALTYSWSASNTGYPVLFSVNGTNAAKSTTVTFAGASNYTLECVITDAGGLSVRTSVVVQVKQAATGMQMNPPSATIAPSATRTFQANLRDQFGNYLFVANPTWSLSGAGTLTPSGSIANYVAPALAGGPYVVTAAASGFSATAQVIVAGTGTPTITAAASATPNPVSGTTSALSVRATDDGGESNLVYHWTVPVMPAPVTFSVNDSNAAKDTVVTFTAPGFYTLVVNAVDELGNAASSTLSVAVDATPTTLMVTPPTATVEVGQSVAFTATVVDQFGQLISPAPTLTFTVSGGGTVEPSGLFLAGATPGGPFQLTVSAGSLSANVDVTVTPRPDTEPPMVSLVQPLDGARLMGSATLSATASDDIGVTRVEFFAEGTTSLGAATASPWEAVVDTTTLSEGLHVLTARAFDAAGHVATSDAVTVVVGNVPVDQSPPVVSVVSPAEGAETSLRPEFVIDATDDFGVTQVALELDGAVVNTLGAAPWTVTLDVSASAHQVVAIARDASGKSTRSAVVHFTARDASVVEPPPPDPTTTEPPEAVVGGCGCQSTQGLAFGFVLLVMRSRRRRAD